jgi:DNA-directed DNA polymerase III PolC
LNYVSAANHPDSSLSGTTVESMVGRAKELGLDHIAITDLGYMSSVLKAYMYGKKKGVKVIPGVEIIFKDTLCPLSTNTESERIRYFKFIIHARDQEAYQFLVKKCSDMERSSITLSENKYPLFNWKDLEEIGKLNVTATNSDVNDIITKHLLVGRPDISIKHYEKIKEIFGDKFYPSIITSNFYKYWDKIVRIKYVDRTIEIPINDRVEIQGKNMAKAADLLYMIRKENRAILTHVYVNKIKYKIQPQYQEVKRINVINDFKDVSEGDLQQKANLLIYGLARKYGDLDRLLINNYSFYPDKDDKVVQDMRLGDSKRIHQPQYMADSEDTRKFFLDSGFDDSDFEKARDNSNAWAKTFDAFELKYEYRLPDVGVDINKQMMNVINKYARMKWDNPAYTTQFKEEYELLTNNGVINLLPYFLPLVDIFDFYKDNGYLTGPARGSAGGFLLSYIMGITHIDPIKYGLSSSRFLTIDRIKNGNLPDIDSDFESREPLVGKNGYSGFLYGKYGNRAAQISTSTLLRIKSAILDANRFMNNGEVEESVQKLSKSLPNTPQGISDVDFVFGYTDGEGHHVDGLFETNKDLQQYAATRPKEWNIVQKALSIARQKSRHACAYVIADRPIEDIVPVFEVGGVKNVTQPEAKQCEFAGLIKYDFLVVSSVKDNRMAVDYINVKNGDKNPPGYFRHNGELLYIWDLPEDPEVFAMLSRGETETVFQLNTTSVTPFVKKIKPESIIDCATITSLVRPGPLDFVDPSTGRNMVEEFVERKYGRSKSDIPILQELLPETYGVLVYQEQVTKIARELGKMNVIDSENVRIAMGKKQVKLLDSLKPQFIAGARETVGDEVAEKVWSMMATFARYGFNKSHAVAYSVISYACAFLKHHYPLEWWAAVITNADNKEINEVFYKYIKDTVLPPDINVSTEQIAIDYTSSKIRNKLSTISGLGSKIANKIIDNRPYTNIEDFVQKKVCGAEMSRKLIIVGALDSIFPKGSNFIQKLQAYETAVSKVEFNSKIEDKRIQISKEIDSKKSIRLKRTLEALISLGPKMPTIPAVYLSSTSIKQFLMKKAVFPTMNLDLHKIILNRENTTLLLPATFGMKLVGKNGRDEYPLLTGEDIQEMDANMHSQDVEAAAAAYVVETREFSYKNNTKKALSMTLDISGYITEKVLWPDRITNELEYPKNLKKGCIGIFLFQKRADSEYTNLLDIYVEQEAL